MRIVILLFLLTALVCCSECASLSPCSVSSDCGAGECCISNVRPIGKRQLSMTGGSCRARGHQSEGCLMRNSVYHADQMFFNCPCTDGLICKGNGMIDIPLGEMGNCVQP